MRIPLPVDVQLIHDIYDNIEDFGRPVNSDPVFQALDLNYTDGHPDLPDDIEMDMTRFLMHLFKGD